MNKKNLLFQYILSDTLSAAFSWTSFFIFRKLFIEPNGKLEFSTTFFSANYFIGLIMITCFWLLLHYSSGYYTKKYIYRKSRLKELAQTIRTTIIGVVIIFFILILDDVISTYKAYYKSISALFIFQFMLTYIPRFAITTNVITKLRNRVFGYNTLLVGSNEQAMDLFHEINSQPKSSGNKFVGFINVHEKKTYLLSDHLQHFGDISALLSIIKEKNIEEVIIAIETSEHEEIKKILNVLTETDAIIRAIPSLYDILRGSTRISTPYSVPLIEISHDLMSAWEENTKRVLDVVASSIALIILSPVFLILAIGVKLSSKGAVFYSQERIGRYGKPFAIYKFRSMCVGAENKGPALSSQNDSRITSFGKFMRRTRLDELPQFYNVVVGDMSLVGPRPERQFFIDKIVKKAPHYNHLHKVRPGITSWGQVKFGYAENVDEMVERLKYDLIYIENMSLYTDFKIMIYTIKIVFKAIGK